MSLKLEEISDEQLMVSISNGDAVAFKALAERHGLRYRALAYRFLGDMARAEDMVQDAFVKIWTNPERFNVKKAKFTTWFHRVVVNRCLDEKRKKTAEALPDGFDVIDTSKSVESVLDRDVVGGKLKIAMKLLSERQQTAVKLSYFDELSNQQAADVMNMKIKAYESLLVRSRAKMRLTLAAEKSDLLSALG